MKKVAIIVPKGAVILSSVVGTFKLFSKVNELLTEKDKLPYYAVHLVGEEPGQHRIYNGIFSINIDSTIQDFDQADIVVIPAVMGDFNQILLDNNKIIDWIKSQHAGGAEIASLCVGAFLLGATGLVNGRSCTTHWMAATGFRAMFPQVNLLEQKVITDENGIYTSGGAYSFLNLILYLIEKFNGRELALICAKIFEVDIDRDKAGQAPFAIFKGQKSHEDEAIKKAQEMIENNFSEKLSVEHLASTSALSRRNFIRRFKKATSNTPIEYIQRVKVEAAKKSLESSLESINEVMYQIGYNDGKSFRTIFRKYTGLSPVEYRNKYNRVAIE